MDILLKKLHAAVPKNATIVDLSNGNAIDAGVISDRRGELPPVVVLSSKYLNSISPIEEDRLVKEAIKELPQYLEVRAQERSYDDAGWNVSFRLGFFPITQLRLFSDTEYKMYEKC